jgi:hypothetical protein
MDDLSELNLPGPLDANRPRHPIGYRFQSPVHLVVKDDVPDLGEKPTLSDVIEILDDLAVRVEALENLTRR